jgi:hypothetical protein
VTPPDLRWRERESRWAPTHRLFRPSEFGVDVLPDDSTPRAFVERHHYSGSYPAARLRVGLYRKVGCLRSYLAGVAVFSVPCQPAALPRHLGSGEGVELGRLVLLDEVGFNGESWFMARAFSALRRELPGVVGVLSYSDPLPRWTDAGRMVTPGHVGQVYQALNAAYLGTASARKLYLDRDGRTISDRGLSKIRAMDKGWEPAAARLVAAGADPRRPGEEPRDWLARVLPGFRQVRHPGNHVYVWRWSGPKPESLPYPRRA